MSYPQGSIVEVSFDPSLGHEPQKTRPAVVLSVEKVNLMSSLTVVAPITTNNNRYPLHIEIAPDNAAEGFVCIEQIAAIDLSARKHNRLGELDSETMAYVLDAVGAVFGI
ncbi:endoribonuclease ChpB [Actinomycetota bacterium]|nr:endoribonuclease ChpB [Actinomycetota bacterium]